MNNSKNLSLHYLMLVGVIALGAIVRFWHLDLKPLWLDEVLTALFSLGRGYEDVPLEIVFPLTRTKELFTLNSATSCPEIAHTLATQSTHPPLFFCLMHRWLSWMEPVTQAMIWKLRALPALFGVCAIAAIYCLNRIAFSPAAGLMGATLMAFSPFAVYLSQEARHYTLPVLVITLALWGLVHIQKTLYSQQQPRPIAWLLWGIVNSIGCYIHYFFLLAFIAQLLTLFALMYRQRRQLPVGTVLAVMLVIVGVAVSYLPWLPMLLGSFGRTETGWLPKPVNIAPLYQAFVGWILMVIALPVESQPVWIQIPVALLMIGFGSWIGWQAFKRCKHLWRQPETYVATFTLSCFTLCVLLQFFAIVYLLGKDITIAPRYNFVYFPALCALLGASLVNGKREPRRKMLSYFGTGTGAPPLRLLLPCFLSFLSCVFVISNLAFLKPFHPGKVAQDMNLEPEVPLMVVMGYNNNQHIALGLSYALALDRLNLGMSKETTNASFVFLNPEQSYQLVWQKLSKLPALPEPRWNLWVVAPGLRDEDYPAQLIAGGSNCTNDATQHHRHTVPYQLYRCTSTAS